MSDPGLSYSYHSGWSTVWVCLECETTLHATTGEVPAEEDELITLNTHLYS